MPILDELIAWLADLMLDLANYIANIVDSIVDIVSAIVNQIKTLLTTIFTDLKTALKSVVDQITAAMNTLIDKIKTAFQDIVNFLYDLISPLLAKVQTLVDKTLQAVTSGLAVLVTQISGYINQTLSFLLNTIADFVAPIAAWFSDVAVTVKSLVASAVTNIMAAFTTIAGFVKTAIDSIVGTAGSLVSTVNERISSFAAALETVADKVIANAKQVADEQGQHLTDLIDGFLEPIKTFIDPAQQKLVQNALIASFTPGSNAALDRLDAATIFTKFMPESGLGRAAFLAVAGPMVAVRLYMGMTDAVAQVVLQEYAVHYHYQLLSPPDSVQAMLRGSIAETKAVENIVKAGWSPDDAKIMIANAATVPPMGELTAMRLREIISPERFAEAAKQQGLATDYVEAYKQLAEVIPSVQDLIWMSVKGAFSEEEISRFRTMEDFPQSVVEWGKKQGLSEQWLKRYWAAHWSLPSPSQGFEMFQREIISPEDLQVLLKALDITPFWRDQMTKLSYNVLTRVDVRRMHQLGLMNREQLVKAHKHMGYSPKDAEDLTTYVEQLNIGKPGEADEEFGRLSRTNVVNFYQDGTIPRQRAIELLVDIGYTPQAAELFIDTADFDAERAQRNAEIDFIIASTVAGVLDFGAAQDKLSELHLSPTEKDKATAKLLREQSKRTKLPTMEQGEKMFKSKVINEDQYKDLLTRLGYRTEWANAFIALAKVPTKPNSQGA